MGHTPKFGDRVRADLTATRGDDTLHVELRPAVEVLRASDATTISARVPPGVGPTDRRAVVFRDTAHLDPDAVHLLRERGLTVFTVDIDAGIVRETPPDL